MSDCHCSGEAVVKCCRKSLPGRRAAGGQRLLQFDEYRFGMAASCAPKLPLFPSPPSARHDDPKGCCFSALGAEGFGGAGGDDGGDHAATGRFKIGNSNRRSALFVQRSYSLQGIAESTNIGRKKMSRIMMPDLAEAFVGLHRNKHRQDHNDLHQPLRGEDSLERGPKGLDRCLRFFLHVAL